MKTSEEIVSEIKKRIEEAIADGALARIWLLSNLWVWIESDFI